MAAPEHGPPDPNLWLTRKASFWETQLLLTMDHAANFCVVLNAWIKSDHIDPVKLEQAYRAMIYNQPYFRADVRKEEDGSIYFTPASDYSDVFEFVDQSGDVEKSGYAGCWGYAEEIADTPLQLGAGFPLNKCYLVKRHDGYNVFVKFHHAIGDGITSFGVLNEVFRQYDLLQSGEEVDLAPAQVTPSTEELVQNVRDDAVVMKMVQGRVERAMSQQVHLPVNQEEVVASRSQIPFRNRTLHAIGTKQGFTNLKTRCKELGVTVGSYSFAALILAQAAVYVRKHGNEIPEGGIPTYYQDVLADLRTRLEPDPGPCFMLCVAETEVKAEVDESTRLFELAGDVGRQLQVAYEEKRFPLMFSCIAECKRLLEASQKSAEGDGKSADGKSEDGKSGDGNSENGKSGDDNEFKDGNSTREFIPSNQLAYKHPTKYSWGELLSTHTLGSYWCPKFSNQVVLFQCVNDVMCYTVVCCDGRENVGVAEEVLQVFVRVVEGAGELSVDTGVMDLVEMV